MTAETRTGRVARAHPSALAIGFARGGIELRQFFREKDAMVFSFFYPAMMLAIFGTIFDGTVEGTGVNFRQVFAAGITATGIMAIGFQNLAVAIAMERDDGTLKRLRGTPMPAVSYFLGKVLLVLISGVAQLALMLALGTLAFGLELPDASGWFTLGWVFVLGLTASSLLGIAMSSLPRSGRAATAVVVPPFLILQFISGVFFLFNELPAGLQQVAALFPLKWMCQGLRSVFLPDSFQSVEPAGSWELDRVALILAVWAIAGLVLCVKTFRWQRREVS